MLAVKGPPTGPGHHADAKRTALDASPAVPSLGLMSCDGLAFWKLIRDDESEISLRQLRDESPWVDVRAPRRSALGAEDARRRALRRR
jgi:hypothetical protein